MSFYAASLFSILSVAIDRFWAICYPVTYHVKPTKITKIIIAIYWILAFIYGFFPLMKWNSDQLRNQCDLRIVFSLTYLQYASLPIGVVALTLIIVLHSLIFLKIQNQVNVWKFKQIVKSIFFYFRQKSEKKS